jgi:hypothetical protein
MIQKQMLRDKSKQNKTFLLHLFNTLLANTYAPAQWENTVFIPLHAKSDWVYLTTLIKYLKVKYIVSVVFPVLA